MFRHKFFIFLILVSTQASAHKDTTFSIQADGSIKGFSEKYGPAKIKIDNTKDKSGSVSLEIQIKNNLVRLPPCIFNLFSKAKLENLGASGSWYHGNWFSRTMGSDLPPYLNLIVANNSYSAGLFLDGYSMLFNMKNAKLIEVTKHIFNKEKNSHQVKKIRITKICRKDELRNLSPIHAK